MSAAARKESYDAVFVGAGIIGLACAWRAAQRGLDVLVLDRAEPGAGASGVAAGMLAPVTEADFSERELLDLNLRGAARWPEFAAELEAAGGESIGYRACGALVAATEVDDVGELKRLLELQRGLGLEVEWAGPRELRALEPGLSPRVAGGIVASQDGRVDPRATLRALQTAFAAAGGELRRAEVTSIRLAGERVVGVDFDGGRIDAAEVVVAAGAHTALLELPELAPAPPVRPVKGQILRLRGTGPLLERIVRTPRCYIVDRGDGRVVIGATVEEQGFDERVTADGVFRLLEAAREVLPEVAELELYELRAALRPGTPDNLPVIGRAEVEGLVWATGHYRNGVLLAPLTADIVTTTLTGAAR